MIKSFSLQNFKLWENKQDVKLAPLTGLFGVNSSGKSSLIQILLLLKQTVESSDRNNVLYMGNDQSNVEYRSFWDIINKHDTKKTFSFSINWELIKPLVIKNPQNIENLFNIRQLFFDVNIKYKENNIEENQLSSVFVNDFLYHFNGDIRDDLDIIENKFGMSYKYDQKKENVYKLNYKGNYKPIRNHARVWPLPSPVKFYGFPDEFFNYYQNVSFLSELVLEFEKLFKNIAYLGPLRDYPRKSYLYDGQMPKDVGKKGEKTIAAILHSRSKGKYISLGKGVSKQTLEERIGYWLKKMEMIYDFSLEQIAENRKEYELYIQINENSPKVLITDVGFGISQILPILTLCYYMPEGSVVILEQPEIHLHPSVQAVLADVFIEVVTKRNIQLIIESHSEHLLRRFQRRIAENNIALDKTTIYFCDRDKKGLPYLKHINIDKGGNIDNWPDNFFGDELGDLIAMSKAGL